MHEAESGDESVVEGGESDPEPEQTRQAKILAALDGPIEAKRSSLSYRMSVALATLIVLALPLVYVGVAVAVGWTAVWTARRGDIAWAIMAGAVFLLLSKALFARPVRIVRPRRLEPEEQPFLFEFVRRLSQRLRAPEPKRIYVDLQVNASASFLWGAGIVQDDLALTIGLPLVSSTSLGQFTAVLAHELGHFSQGTAMRSHGLSAAVNRWFARVVYQRDALDLALAKLAEAASHLPYKWGFALIFLGARGCIWLTRRLLFGLMVASARITARLSRQMEFDADQNAVCLCGSQTLVGFLRLLPVIEASSAWAATLNERQLREGALSDDYPELVRYGLEELGDEWKARLVEHAMDTTAGMYASHPPTRLRIEHAEALGLAGRFAEAPEELRSAAQPRRRAAHARELVAPRRPPAGGDRRGRHGHRGGRERAAQRDSVTRGPSDCQINRLECQPG